MYKKQSCSVYCNHCAKDMSNNFKFCPVCGSRLFIPKSTNKTGKIVIAIAIPIVLIIILLGINFYALSNLQFRMYSVDEFDFFDLSMGNQFEVCNPTFFPASFNKLEIDILYKNSNLATQTVWGQNIPSMTPTVLDGQVKLNGESLLQLFLASMGSSFGGQGANFDPNQMRFNGKLDALILGIIPFSVSQTFSTDEFIQIMQGNSGKWSC